MVYLIVCVIFAEGEMFQITGEPVASGSVPVRVHLVKCSRQIRSSLGRELVFREQLTAAAHARIR